ncbi:DNA adenine methylase [Aureimonas sp. AU40]|uniref:DNA adenine methylase n=1 Tax=Aureimonas sp. AU40 TaxID=1637747 RepID=UPI000784D733|nr:DNA adenine methylase [Aureimonas sp. AU40]
MEFELKPVSPAAPAAGYIGGKRNLARRIIARIDATPHDGYAEPFVGMGGVFLRRSLAPRFEAVNDISGDVATFFRILQRHYVAFLDMLRFQIASRREFERLSATDPSTLTDLERSARFLYLQRLSFGGKVTSRTFGVSTNSGSRFNVTKLGPMLEAIHERLAGVVIERLSWQEFIRRYDRPGMLFYLDPPYFGTEHFYGRDAFTRDQFAEMAEQLRLIKGRFILSLNDHTEVRRIFDGFAMEEEGVTYVTGGHGPRRAGELIIKGPSNGP